LVEIDINDWGQIERDGLREDHAADDYEAERLAGFTARAEADGDRDCAEERCRGGHHDRTESRDATGEDRLRGVEAVLRLGLESEVDLHDCVLLHKTD